MYICMLKHIFFKNLKFIARFLNVKKIKIKEYNLKNPFPMIEIKKKNVSPFILSPTTSPFFLFQSYLNNLST